LLIAQYKLPRVREGAGTVFLQLSDMPRT